MIYTGYYARDGLKNNAVGISVYIPHYLSHMPHVPLFAPTMKMVYDVHSGKISDIEYTELFVELLNSRNIPWLELGMELQGKIMCCFEKSDDFCHRHIIAKKFKEYGFEVEEWNDKINNLSVDLFDFE